MIKLYKAPGPYDTRHYLATRMDIHLVFAAILFYFFMVVYSFYRQLLDDRRSDAESDAVEMKYRYKP